jgi:hypothetical protein
MKIDKKTLIIGILFLILLGMLFYFIIYPQIHNSIYQKGLNDGTLNVIYGQMQTGNILIINNGVIESYPISSFCGGNENEE